MAKFRSFAVGGVPPEIMGVGPVVAVPKAVKLAGLELSDINLFELNEAFASQSLQVIRELGLDEEKVNVNGGAIALGHPLGCTGAKLTLTLIHEIKRRNQQFGVVTMCIGGGMGAAGVFELLIKNIIGRNQLFNRRKNMQQTEKIIKGGSFLIDDISYDRILTPEDFTEEQ